VKPFTILGRTFFAQFFASELVTSDHQLRQALIGVLAFLVMPGLLIPFQLSSAFEFAAIRFPALLEPLTRLMATIFITYAIVTIGVVGAFAWDALGFDRRDAMVLGPLPVSGTLVIAAKLAALGVLLLGTAAAINLLTAVPFAMVASSHKSTVTVGRHMIAHLVATMAAATFVFCVLVTIRAVVGTLGKGGLAIGTLVQFGLISALLCFVVFVPTAVQIVPVRRRVVTVQMQPIPAWSPTNWFLGLYEVVRGTSGTAEFRAAALNAILFTWTAITTAIVTTVAGYHAQLQRALAPSATPPAARLAKLQAALARWLAGSDRVARATAEFVVTTVMRNRAQQLPIAINTAIAVALLAGAFSRNAPTLAGLTQPRILVLCIPLLFGYWMTIGVRAAFFVPAELQASWTFRANGPAAARSYWRGTHAAMLALIVPPVLFVTAIVTLPLLGARIAAWHAAFVIALHVALVNIMTLTVNHVPFTRPYQPGHAKLKTRWPLYLIGMVVFALVSARLERASFDDASFFAIAGAVALMFQALAWRHGSRWSVEPREDDVLGDVSDIAVLDIGAVRT
jgi:hypothetical protein